MKIIVGTSASIAIYRACDLVRELSKSGYDVHVVMTRTAARWIHPVIFEALSGNLVVTDRTASGMAHITLRQDAKLFLLAPATADVIARAAQGRADDVLTATLLAFEGPRWLAPAMNPAMYAHPATQSALRLCESYGYRILSPENGEAVCGDVGQGKMMQVEEIVKLVKTALPLGPRY
ncbi:MAG: phosphopantothenoylcysteine decarboxylase [Turneriella sp.]|nr:phosphopantothenoylcysteine decarboxylase [Turneriella sp.]